MVTALGTGARLGELLALQWRDIDLDTGYLSIQRSLANGSDGREVKLPKTSKSRRRIDLPQFVISVLNGHRRKQLAAGLLDAPVFCTRQGGHSWAHNVQDALERLIGRAGVRRIRFHDMRHTHATLLLGAGTHPKVVSERLGHASVQITLDRYSHMVPTIQQNAASQLDGMLGGQKKTKSRDQSRDKARVG